MRFPDRRFSAVACGILIGWLLGIEVNRSWGGEDLTTRIANILNQGTDGTSGLYLKQVNGPVLAAEDEAFAFYPASTIKVLKHLYGMRQVEAGVFDLDTTLVFVCPSCGDCASCDPICPCTPSCSQPCNAGVNCADGLDSLASCGALPDLMPLRCVLQRMMFISDNQATNATQNLFGNGDASVGRANLNDLANNIVGMSANTALYHKFACGNVANNPFNISTLADLGLLYEKVATDPNVLQPATVPTFYQLMLNETLGGLIGVIQNVVDAEAATLGMAGSDVDVAALKSNIRLAYKAGNIGSAYVSIAGWIQVPFIVDCSPTVQEYVFGLFIHGATTNTLNLQSVVGELLRDELHAALEAILCDRPPVVSAPEPLIVECNAAGGVAGDDPQILDWLNDASALDDCDGDVAVMHTAVPDFLSVDCESEEAATITFTALDACGNSSMGEQTITVQDTTPPEITCPENVTVRCNTPQGRLVSEVPFEATATDNCDDDPTLFDDKPDLYYPPTCDGPANMIRFVAIDDCGNFSDCVAEVRVIGPMCCPAITDTDLVLMPIDLDLRQDTNGPISTKAKFDIWNEMEARFSGSVKCLTCWDQTLLGFYDEPNHFLPGVLQTDKGKARIDGIDSPVVCDRDGVVTVPSPLLGVAIKETRFAGSPLVEMRSAMHMVGAGEESALILYDITDPSDPLHGPDSGDGGGLRIGPIAEVLDENARPLPAGVTPTLGAPANRASISQKGSLLFWPSVELKWDFAGRLIADTIMEVANDTDNDVHVQLYFVNGDEPLPPVLIPVPPFILERPHPGWNNVDVQLPLTGNQPVYWSVSTGLPAGVSPFTVLDPGFPPGRPDSDPTNPGGRVLRGFVVGWAVNAAGHEIRWNHLKGDATSINYLEATAWEYETWAFRVVSGVAHGSESDPVPGQLRLDGIEYDLAPDQLVLDFYSAGSNALSHPSVR